MPWPNFTIRTIILIDTFINFFIPSVVSLPKQVCKKQFRQSSTLNNHIKIHVSDKPFLQELQEAHSRFKTEPQQDATMWSLIVIKSK